MAPALGPTYDVGAGEAGRYGEAGNAPRPAARPRAAGPPAPVAAAPPPAPRDPPPPAARPPRGYRRPDERIWDDVCLRIARSGLDAGAVDVTVVAGVVALEGAVATRAEKWALEEIAAGVLGVVDVDNRLRVDPDAAELHASAAGEGASPAP
jgi:hypothetical protein